MFAGTTNADSYLKDETGGRRFWPVKAGITDVAALRRDRDQLWAEAVARYHAGEQWWLTREQEKELTAPEQAARLETDPWQELIVQHYAHANRGDDHVTIPAIMVSVLKLDPKDQDKGRQMRVAKILTQIGYKKTGKRTPKNAGEAPIWELAD